MMYCFSLLWRSERWLNKIIAIFACTLTLVPGIGLTYAKACQENAMLVFDASGSMKREHDGMPKIMAAREAAGDILPDITGRRPTGLVTYGGWPSRACGDVHLKVPPMLNSGGLIVAELSLMEPAGQTPLSDAVILAAKTLAGLGRPGVVVLVTDGLENCGYDICMAARKLKAEAPNIRVHIIGFHLKIGHESRIACLPQATNGTYTSTNSLETLREASREKLHCVRIS